MSALLEEAHEVPAPQPAEQQNPIQSFQLRQNVGGVDTEVLIQTFDDRILVLVTQNGKVGPLVSACVAPIDPN